jgi:hypothetical protein
MNIGSREESEGAAIFGKEADGNILALKVQGNARSSFE